MGNARRKGKRIEDLTMRVQFMVGADARVFFRRDLMSFVVSFPSGQPGLRARVLVNVNAEMVRMNPAVVASYVATKARRAADHVLAKLGDDIGGRS